MDSRFMRLFVVRHGETAANREMRYIGSRDDALTERGAWQAQQLAAALMPLRLAAIYSSPLRRAYDTASAIARASDQQVVREERLLEGAMGDWEGLHRAEVLARSPEDAEAVRRWESDPNSGPPNGESLLSVQERVVALVHELAARHAGESIALVSHVGPIKALLCAAMDAPLTASRRMFLDPATISVVDWGSDSVAWAPVVLRLFNAHHHLGWEAARWM